jgi:hypothetical protein
VDNAAPTRGQTVTLSVTSNVPTTRFTAVAHYESKDTVRQGTTDGSGAGSVAFRISTATSGFKVVVEVDISGRALCQTSFTTQ